MRKPQTEAKHLVYAEDIIQELMQYPDNAIYKHELRRLVEKVVTEKEVAFNAFFPYAGTLEDDGDIYD